MTTKAAVIIVGNKELSGAVNRLLQRAFEVEGTPVIQHNVKIEAYTKNLQDLGTGTLITLILTNIKNEKL